MTALPTRRRVLFLGAAFMGAAALPGARQAFAEPAVRRWRGQALGAHATIELLGAPQDVAGEAFAAVEAEIARLEAIFSLYRSDSELARLNRDSRLAEPSPELLAVLTLADAAHRQTDGLFDPTVQPLFSAFAEHFSRPGADPAGPPRDAVETALSRVGFEQVRFDPTRVGFARPGMAMTLNGIAQGFITDRVATLLRERGFADMLLDIGEIRAVGHGPSGAGWRIGIRRDPLSGRLAETVTVSDRAVATSMALGTTLDPAGRVGHIFHPRKGPVAATFAHATVIDASAARADALSTAAALMTPSQLAALRASGAEVRV